MKKIYLVTGASADLGIHFLRELEERCRRAEEHCVVYGQYNQHGDELIRLAGEMEFVELHAVRCALDDGEEVERWIARLREDGVVPTHILHLAALKLTYMRIRELDWERVQREMDVQLRSFALLLRAFLPCMMKRGYGRIVAVLSACTLGAAPRFMCSYLTVKYALLGFIKAAAAECRGSGVTVNGVSPNMMETKFLSEIDPRYVEINARNSAMGRNISLEETSGAIFYLLSDAASYVTGTNLNLSGGDYM